jgi:hypothetical protein
LWELFGSCLLNSTANPARFAQELVSLCKSQGLLFVVLGIYNFARDLLLCVSQSAAEVFKLTACVFALFKIHNEYPNISDDFQVKIAKLFFLSMPNKKDIVASCRYFLILIFLNFNFLAIR